MREEVFQIHRYSVGHRIDKQLLISLEDIFTQYNEKAAMEISTECTNNTKYSFTSIDECFDYFTKKPHRIVKMELSITFGQSIFGNKIKMTFDNRISASTEIQFNFNNNDDYLLLKNKIELCLKNFRLNYRLLSVIPIMPTLLTIVFVGICMYTGRNDIVFPSVVQKTIISIWAIGSFMFGLLPPFVRIKRNIFPCTEFRIGQNELIEENNSKKRNFIISTVVIGMVIGLIVNYVSDFLF